MTSEGYGLILMVSAPVGEELCKAAAVYALAVSLIHHEEDFRLVSLLVLLCLLVYSILMT